MVSTVLNINSFLFITQKWFSQGQYVIFFLMFDLNYWHKWQQQLYYAALEE